MKYAIELEPVGVEEVSYGDIVAFITKHPIWGSVKAVGVVTEYKKKIKVRSGCVTLEEGKFELIGSFISYSAEIISTTRKHIVNLLAGNGLDYCLGNGWRF